MGRHRADPPIFVLLLLIGILLMGFVGGALWAIHYFSQR